MFVHGSQDSVSFVTTCLHVPMSEVQPPILIKARVHPRTSAQLARHSKASRSPGTRMFCEFQALSTPWPGCSGRILPRLRDSSWSALILQAFKTGLGELSSRPSEGVSAKCCLAAAGTRRQSHSLSALRIWKDTET